MILAALLLLGQDAAVPAPADAIDVEEIVVRARYGRTTMLFDKGSDGKLYNCRIMVSSGSQKRDADACQATPVCYAGTADEVTDCVELLAVEPAAAGGIAPVGSDGATQIFEMPRLVRPKATNPAQAGPLVDTTESREAERQRVELPPLPQAPRDGAAVKVVIGDGRREEQR